MQRSNARLLSSDGAGHLNELNLNNSVSSLTRREISWKLSPVFVASSLVFPTLTLVRAILLQVGESRKTVASFEVCPILTNRLQWNGIQTIGITLIKCMSLWGLKIFPCILLVHWCAWYDWYQWNIIYSIGIPLVKCISLWGLRIFPSASGWVGCILHVHWYDWYDWYQWNNIYSSGILLVKCFSLQGLR